MIKANEARKITNEAIEKQKEEEKKNTEKFLELAEKKIKETADKGQSTCYVHIPDDFKYHDYKILEALRDCGYGAQTDCFDIMVTW